MSTRTARRAPPVADRAIVLHRYLYSETSVIAELFTREQGRVAVLAKGAKRPGSKLSSALASFQELDVVFSGHVELKTLRSADWRQIVAQPSGANLLAGFYVCELLFKLLPKEDPHPALFDHSVAALSQLSQLSSAQQNNLETELLLRRFETHLLRELGFSPDWAGTLRARMEQAIQPTRYWVSSQSGIQLHEPRHEQSVPLTWLGLQALATGEFPNALVRAEAKLVLRHLLQAHLPGRALHSRRISQELIELQRALDRTLADQAQLGQPS